MGGLGRLGETYEVLGRPGNGEGLGAAWGDISMQKTMFYYRNKEKLKEK